MNRWAGLAAGLMLATGAGAPVMAQEPPEGFAWYVLNELNGFGFDIEDPTNRPALATEVPAGVLVPVDLNGDARTDWMIAWPDSTQFCGTGGCRRSLYMATDDGFRRVFDRQVLDMTIGRVEGEIRVEAQVHHLECGDRPEGCHYAWAWSPAMEAFDERPTRDGWSRIQAAEPLVTWARTIRAGRRCRRTCRRRCTRRSMGCGRPVRGGMAPWAGTGIRPTCATRPT